MSLIETQEIMATLQEIMQMLNDAGYKVKDVTQQVTGEGGGNGGGGHSLRSEFRVMNMYMMAIQQWSGSDTLTGVANKIQQTEQVILRFYMLIEAVNDILMATSLNPFMVAYGVAHGLGFVMSIQNLLGQ